MSATENRRQLAERATELIKLLDADLAVLDEIHKRWNDDRTADEEIYDLHERAGYADGEATDVYIAVSGIYNTSGSLVTELRQALDAGERLHVQLRKIAAAVEATLR